MNAADAERAVLGAILSGHRMDDLHLTEPDFYHPAHGQVWEACQRVAATGQRPDPVTVRMALGQVRLPQDAGLFLVELMEACPISAQAQTYARIVQDAASRRRLHEVATRIGQLAESDRDPDVLIEDARQLLDQTPRRYRAAGRTVADFMPDVIDLAEKGQAAGLPSPWAELDEKTQGWHPGRLYVVGARPGVGKSILGIAAATHAARQGKAAFVASIEMPETEVGMRMLAATARVDQQRLTAGTASDHDWTKISTATTELSALPIVVDDSASQTVESIRSAARSVARRHDLGLIVVDYLQLLRPRDPKAPREQQVAESSRGLKRLARELEVPVIALAQVGRGALQRQDQTPTLSDLRESGAIEADADVVLLLHREPPPDDHRMRVIVAKNRSGPKGEIPLDVWGHYSSLTSPYQRGTAS